MTALEELVQDHSEVKAERKKPGGITAKASLDASADRANKHLSSLKAHKVKLTTCYIQEGDKLAQNCIKFM